MIVGEIANFVAYAFAPALLVTPLGALSIIIRHGLDIAQSESSNVLNSLLILDLVLQCCSCTYHFRGEATYFWGSWLYSMCGGLHNHCSSCTSRTWNRIRDRSLANGNGARYKARSLESVVSVYYFISIVSYFMEWFFFYNSELFFMAAFLLYATLVITSAIILIFHFIPQYGQTHIMVYIGVCSLLGSLSVSTMCSL